MDNSQLTRREQFVRQENVFPTELRTQSLVLDAAGEGSVATSRFVKAAAAGAGIPIASDSHEYDCSNAQHPMLADHEAMVRSINAEATYEYLDQANFAEDLAHLLGEYRHAAVLLHVGQPPEALARLRQLQDVGARVPVIMIATTPSGLAVWNSPDPQDAALQLQPLQSLATISPGPTEVSMMAAGLALGELMFGPRGAGLVGYYCTAEQFRVRAPADALFGDLVHRLVKSAGPIATLSHRRYVSLGGGALGTWIGLGLALESDVQLHIVDGDLTIESHNRNRQILYRETDDQHPKAPVLARELGRIDPAGRYTGEVRMIQAPADLTLGDADALMVGPDNDQARLVAAEAARGRVPCAIGGTGALGGQAILQAPDGACYECSVGHSRPPAELPAENESCGLQEDANVAPTMVIAGLMVSQIRCLWSGLGRRNVRYVANAASAGNRLGRATTPASCRHLPAPKNAETQP